ncbi:macro domain-containing protein [Novosphingobium sp. 1949]|uniref:Macro domain-containing protein n=1 Tax=Novosphingobium organovorum TaxID=2930092 RepID=A0ABT0BHA2_9SPHN|nr:macro domain-containing protein [Novosphingobium organovorum]MCJ2184414.1 macro domain-containing protein [Novosphingobium organovorum]
MLEFTQGDMFEASADIRVNTVNCVGVMGAGVAKAFKQRYPEMFKDYQSACKDGQVRPGQMYVWKSLEGDWIINFPTKRHWRNPSRYEDIEAGLDDLRAYLEGIGPVTVALPALGCGNGGLDWGRVSNLIRDKLDGLNAHILVFAPSASHQAGRAATEAPTDDERAIVAALGYQTLEPGGVQPLALPGPFFLLGNPQLLSRKWIALLPSRAPGDREMQALRTIAAELARSGSRAAVALVHGTKVSEDIAQIFVDQGIDTLLLLPFGVLTRKAIARQPAMQADRRPALASTAPPSANWSRQLFAQCQDLLRTNAAAMLLSDPEPDWLTSKGLGKWAQTPISYVRYETTPIQMREALAGVGARRIARRGNDGSPDIDALIAAVGPGDREPPADNGDRDVGDEADRADPAAELSVRDEPVGTPEAVTIVWDTVPKAARRDLFACLTDLDANGITLSIGLPPDLEEVHRERLKSLLAALR